MRRLTFVIVAALGTVAASAPAFAAGTVVVHSPNFAGYTASSSTAVSSFQGKLNVPTVSCPATGNYTLQPQVHLGTSGPAGVQVYELIFCNNGQSFNDQFNAVVTNSTGTSSFGSVQIAAGDSLKFKMVESPSGAATVTVSDITTGTSASATAPGVGSLTQITGGTSVDGPNPPPNSPIPTFSPITFGGLQFGASTLTAFSPTKSEIYDGAVRQVSTSAISTGGTFSNKFVHV